MGVTVAGTLAFLVCPSGFAQGGGPGQAELNQWLNSLDSKPWPAPQPAAPALTGQAGGGQQVFGQQGLLNRFSRQWPPAGSPLKPGPAIQQAAPAPSPFNMTRQDLLRMFFGGSSGSSAAGNQQKYYDASSFRQTAVDQASQAEAAASRARYGSDRGARQSAAAEAQEYANAARAAADQATSAAAGGSSEAQDMAAQARDAADRAQYAADRAAANANGGGW